MACASVCRVCVRAIRSGDLHRRPDAVCADEQRGALGRRAGAKVERDTVIVDLIPLQRAAPADGAGREGREERLAERLPRHVSIPPLRVALSVAHHVARVAVDGAAVSAEDGAVGEV